MTSGKSIGAAGLLLLASALISLPLTGTAAAATPLDWNGFYIGGSAGFGVGTADLSTPDGGNTVTRACDAGIFGIIPLYEVPAGSVFQTPETGNQSYPALVVGLLNLVNNGADLYIPQKQGAFDFTATGAPVAADECIYHSAYVIGPGGNYFGGRPGVPLFPLAPPFPPGFVPQDGNGTIVTTVIPGGAGSDAVLGLGGGIAGVQGGYNHQLPNGVLLGVETDLALAGIGGSGALGAGPATATINWFGSVRGRVGIVREAALFYLTAGGAVSGMTVSAGAAPGSTSGTLLGWTAGGGLEYALTDALSLKGEYKYFDFRASSSATIGTTITAAPSFSTVTVGLNYHP